MDAVARRKKLKEIMATPSAICRTGLPITYHGERRTFDAYRIPLEYLVYNPYNGRIGSLVKSYERQNHVLDPEDQNDKAIIEKFLWDSKVDANKVTKRRLFEEGQQLHGIVTADGTIVDGNRRASLLNNIMADASIPYPKKGHCAYFIAIILPEDADKKEILALETTYQMGEDAKVDYNPIEKYLKCKDLTAAGFDIKSIANMMGNSESDIKKMLSAMDLMDDYLETFGYDGMYTQLEKREDAFLNLDSALKKYKKGIPTMRDYDEADISDLKLIAFDYIRAGFEVQPFRAIVAPPSSSKKVSSFFSEGEIWDEFREKHLKAVAQVPEESVPDIIAKNPPDLGAALKARDADWAKKLNEEMRSNYDTSLDKLDNIRNRKEPLKQLIKACQAVDAVDVNQPDFTINGDIMDRVSHLDKVVAQFKKILGL